MLTSAKTRSASLTEELIDLIRAKPIAQTDRRAASYFFLDACANMIGGRRSEPGAVLAEWMMTKSSDWTRDAFYLGALTHILELDDLHRASVTHPGCVVVPAVLALGKHLGAGAEDMLTATLHGFEAMCRVGNSVGKQHYKTWHNTATCGPYGSAMAASTLLGLSAPETVHALGNAGTQSSGLWQFLETGAMSKHLHAGNAAESGLRSAELAAFAFTGPPQILEGIKGFYAGACPDAMPSAVIAEPESAWQLVNTSIKPWPSCRHTHPCIDAALELHDRIENRRINSVRAAVYQATLDVCDRRSPQSEYEAKFSIYHCVAAALTDGHVDLSSFDENARTRLSSLRDQIRVNVGEPYKSAYPDQFWGGKVEVTLDDGSVLSADRRTCKGDPEAPLSEQEFVTKAKMLMRHGGLTSRQSDRLIQAILEMQTGETDWDALGWIFPCAHLTMSSIK